MRTHVHSFPIKQGQCLVLPDRIEVEHRGWTGRLQGWLHSKGLRTAWILYTLLAIALTVGAGITYGIENWFLVAFFALAALGALYAAFQYRNISLATMIQREHVERIEYHPAVIGVSRANIHIWFRRGSRQFEKILYLPSQIQRGTSQADTAFWVLKDAGWPIQKIQPSN
ncbi:hypothetical protein [Pontibacter sp. G13]|uniref:hypothetical protein n=1 Tax=Pontibacter sp. G13 TaxID=3074898 RepID=UPI002889D531|nr:hypothetical protein [Pontibacter sp. G13]WNJ18488.1 hypothetical protein RJD25_26835 [Pontibacter sp. G13]